MDKRIYDALNMDLQDRVSSVFNENFGYTPFKERMNDIQREFFELMKWHDIKNLKEETGDLLASIIKLCAESGWDFSELVNNTLEKIESRSIQYKTLGRKIRVAIYGGAFDPIHIGHIQMAKFVLDTSGEFDEVWLMPAYKHMNQKNMADSKHRINMCEIAAEVDKRIKVFDYEIAHKLAGETYNFLKRLKEEKHLNETYQFSLIMGMDNANTFKSWVNYEELERIGRFIVVPRKGIKRDENVDWYLKPPHIFLNDENTGIIDVSSTSIRELLCSNQHDVLLNPVNPLLDKNVHNYIMSNKMYI